jgi:hypothetical protein
MKMESLDGVVIVRVRLERKSGTQRRVSFGWHLGIRGKRQDKRRVQTYEVG